MPRRRKPVSLMVAEGNPSELSRAELAERRAREPRPTCLDPSPPDWLPDRLVPEFEEIAAKLKGVAPDFFTELDEDCLGRYLVAREQYVYASELYETARDGGDVDDMAKCARMQDIAFKQCRMSGNDLGLSITSRCSLVVPQPQEARSENRFARFAEVEKA